MAQDTMYRDIPSYGFKVKKEDGTFSEQTIRFATTTDYIDDTTEYRDGFPLTLTQSLQQMKTRKCLSAGSDAENISLNSQPPFKKIPLSTDASDGDGSNPGFSSLDNDYLDFSDDGGVICKKNGYVMISGSVYANLSGTTPYPFGVYIYKKHANSTYDTSSNALQEDINQFFYEVMSTYSDRVITSGTGTSGSRILHVNEGDTLYLAARGTGQCLCQHRQTLLNVFYISLD